MADPNPCSSSSPPPPPGYTLDPDEISSLLHTLLQSSSSSSLQHTPEEIRHQFFRSAPFPEPAGGIDSSSGLNFASETAFSGAIGSSAEAIGVGDFDSESERDQVLRNTEASRNSSKRSRVAEFHNLSEKKRRQKINEKMKALQKLIPNSNKTDKASMLDDAIDYLKQLQLQVQMLAMRNGSSLHPFYMTGMHSAQPTPAGIYYNEEEGLPCSSRGIRALYANQEISTRTVYNPADQRASSDQKMFMPFALETGKSDRHFSLDPSTSAHCKPFNLTMSSKELCGDSNLPQLHLTSNRYGDESSSGVSS